MILQDLIQEAYAKQAVHRALNEQMAYLNQKRAQIERELAQLTHQMEQHEYAIGGWETPGTNGAAPSIGLTTSPRVSNGRNQSPRLRTRRPAGSLTAQSTYSNPWEGTTGAGEWERTPQRGRASSFRNVMVEMMREVGTPMTPMQIAQQLAQQMPGRDPERLRKHVIVALNKYNRYFRKVRHGVFELTPQAAASVNGTPVQDLIEA